MNKIIQITVILVISMFSFFAEAAVIEVKLNIDNEILKSPQLTIPDYDEVNGESGYFIYEFTVDAEGVVINLEEKNDNYHYSMITQVENYFKNEKFANYANKSGELSIEYRVSDNPKVLGVIQALDLIGESRDRLPQRREILEDGLAIEPDNVALNFLFADVLSKEGSLDEAITLYKKVIKLTPKNSNPYYSLAYRLYQQEKYNKAKKYVNQSLEFDDLWESHWLLFKIAGEKGRELEALSHIGKAFALTSDDELYLYNERAWYLRSIGAQRLAIRDFKKVEDMEPENSYMLSGIARAYVDLELYDNAKAYSEKALSLNPNDIYDLEVMADIYEGQGEPGKAIEFYQRIIAIDERAGSVLNNFGYLYSRLGKTDKAIETFEYARAIGLDSELVINNLGIAYYWNGNCEKSKAILLEALDEYSRDNGNAITWHYLSDCSIQQEKVSEAFEWFSKSMDADPDYKDALYFNKTSNNNFLKDTLEKIVKKSEMLTPSQQRELKEFEEHFISNDEDE